MTKRERAGFSWGWRPTRNASRGSVAAGAFETSRVLRCVALGLAAFGLSCSSSDSGGMSGTGVSQGAIDSFGSIFVNGIEWNLSEATIELDGEGASESDLRVGMVVRVEGGFSDDGLSGQARHVEFDDSIEGPIAGAPVETIPGLAKSFTVLGTTVIARSSHTVFDDGASFAGLAADQVVEVSGFFDSTGAIHATRIERKGDFPTLDEVELRGQVTNLVKNPDGSGIFDLGPIVVRYTSTTGFSDLTRESLANLDLVEVEGRIRAGTDDEVDASEIEGESGGLGDDDREDVKIEGLVVLCPESLDYCVAGVPVDDSGASFDPPGYVPAAGDRVEVEGSLIGGVLVADLVESEDEDDARDVRIDAAITSVDAAARTLVVLGVTIAADGDTRLEDDSDLDDENLGFGELAPGQYVEIEAVSTGTSTARALSIERDDATAGDDDVRLEGPVTSLDPNAPSLSILGQPIPLDAGTQYRDMSGQTRSEEEFFRNPGDVALGDIVRAKDQAASDLSALTEADEVEIQDPDELGDDGDDDDDDD